MANEMNTGAQKLVERILADARADAAATLKEADEAVQGIRDKAEQEREKAIAASDRQRAEAVNAILERSRTNAELSARKDALDKRRAVLDEAFLEAYKQLCALGGEERGRVCRGLLLREAEGGEVVCPSAPDRALLDELLGSVNKELAAAGKAALTLGDTAEQVAYGFILLGDGFEKDCSFQALLRDIRVVEDTNVSGILFD